MINSNATPILEQNPGQPKMARRTSWSVDRKPPKDPMKLFPYLFQFTSPRLTEAEKSAPTSHEGQPDQMCAQRPLFLAETKAEQGDASQVERDDREVESVQAHWFSL